MKLPSKKIILIACACILAVGGVYFALNPISFKKKNTEAFNEIYLKAITGTQSDTDTDSDGLKDWEETLWGTDPKKADSDGDNTGDGDEIRDGRDPLKAATSADGERPNDLMATSSISAALAKTASSSVELTSTELFARQFFTEYLKLKGQGITIDSAAQQRIINDTLASGNFPIPAPKKYTTSEVNVTNKNTVEGIREYGNNLGKALIATSPKQRYDNEFEVFNKAVTSGDAEEIKKMDIIIDTYTELLNDYAEMQVPSSALGLHLALLNNISMYLTDLHALRGVFEDPIVAYARLATFPADGLKMQQSFRAFPAFFAQNSVTFEQSEDGYIFLHSI